MARFLCSAMVMVLFGCAARYDVTPLSTLPSAPDGVIYFLPRTVLNVTIPVTVSTVGVTELTPWAEATDDQFEQLPIIELPPELDRRIVEELKPKEREEDAIWKSRISSLLEESWVTRKFETPSVATSVEADPNAAFLVRLHGDWTELRSLNLTLNGLGVLTDGESKVDDQKLAIAVTTFESVMKVAGSLFSLPMQKDLGGSKEPTQTEEDPWRARAKELRTTLRRIQYARRRLLSNNTRHELASDTLEKMLIGLKELEDEIRGQFYRKSVTRYDIRFEVRPDDSDLEGVTLVSITNTATGVGDTPQRGIWINSNMPPHILSSKLPASIEGIGSAPPCESKQSCVKLSVRRSKDGPSSVGSVVANSRAPRGFYYRFPGRAVVAVEEYRGDRGDRLVYFSERYHQTFTIAQMGVIASLPPGTRAMSSDFKVKLDPQTGALLNVGFESRSIDQQLITRVGDASATFVDKVSAARAAEEKKSAVESATERLQQLKALQDAARTLGIPIPDLAATVEGLEEGGPE